MTAEEPKNAKEWLKIIEPFFIKDLEERRMRGKVVEIMESYADFKISRIANDNQQKK